MKLLPKVEQNPHARWTPTLELVSAYPTGDFLLKPLTELPSIST